MGLFEWIIALIGLKWLPMEFVRYMTYILIEYLNKFIIVYFNNIIIFSKKLEEHDEHVWLVMMKLIDIGLTLKIKKYKFNIIIVNYLRIVYILEGLKI